MANVLSKPARARPLVGRELTFYVPLPPNPKTAAKMVVQQDKDFLRVRMKDAQAKILGLPKAKQRIINAKIPGTGGVGGQQPTRRKAIGDRTSARAWKIIFAPGTVFVQGNYQWYSGTTTDPTIPVEVQLKSISIYLPTFVRTWQVIEWLDGGKKTYTKDDGSQGPELTGMDVTNYPKIIGVTTPNDITHNFESILYPDIPPVVTV